MAERQGGGTKEALNTAGSILYADNRSAICAMSALAAIKATILAQVPESAPAEKESEPSPNLTEAFPEKGH